MKLSNKRSTSLAAGLLATLWVGAAWADSSCGPNSPDYFNPKKKCSAMQVIKPASGGVGCLNGGEAKYNSGAPDDSACTRDDLTAAVCNVPPPPMGTPAAVYTEDSGPNGLDQCVIKRADGSQGVLKPTCKESNAKPYTRNYTFIYKSGNRQSDVRNGKEKMITQHPVAMVGRDPCQFTAPASAGVTVMCPSSSTPCPAEKGDIKSFGQGK